MTPQLDDNAPELKAQEARLEQLGRDSDLEAEVQRWENEGGAIFPTESA